MEESQQLIYGSRKADRRGTGWKTHLQKTMDSMNPPRSFMYMMTVVSHAYFFLVGSKMTDRATQGGSPRLNISLVIFLRNLILFVGVTFLFSISRRKDLIWTSPWKVESPTTHLLINIGVLLGLNSLIMVDSNLYPYSMHNTQVGRTIFPMLRILLVVPALVTGHFILGRKKTTSQLFSIATVASAVLVKGKIELDDLNSENDFSNELVNLKLFGIGALCYALGNSFGEVFLGNRKHWPAINIWFLSIPVKLVLSFVVLAFPTLQFWVPPEESELSNLLGNLSSGFFYLAVLLQVLQMIGIIWIMINMTFLAVALYNFVLGVTVAFVTVLHPHKGSLSLELPSISVLDFNSVRHRLFPNINIALALLAFAFVTRGLKRNHHSSKGQTPS